MCVLSSIFFINYGCVFCLLILNVILISNWALICLGHVPAILLVMGFNNESENYIIIMKTEKKRKKTSIVDWTKEEKNRSGDRDNGNGFSSIDLISQIHFHFFQNQNQSPYLFIFSEASSSPSEFFSESFQKASRGNDFCWLASEFEVMLSWSGAHLLYLFEVMLDSIWSWREA